MITTRVRFLGMPVPAYAELLDGKPVVWVYVSGRYRNAAGWLTEGQKQYVIRRTLGR
jgi:hypothetical protein